MKTITKDILKACQFTDNSKNPRLPLNCIQITPEEITATDSKRLINIKRRGLDTDIFPNLPNTKKYKEKDESLLLEAKTIKKAKFTKKTDLPILKEGILANETDEDIELITTDLETTSRIKIKKRKDEFPRWKNIIPKQPPEATIIMDAQLLSDSLKAFKGGRLNDVQLSIHKDKLKITGVNNENDNIMVLVVGLI